jgi:hypothetical protein
MPPPLINIRYSIGWTSFGSYRCNQLAKVGFGPELELIINERFIISQVLAK